MTTPNQSPEPIAVADAVVSHAASRRWLSFGRYLDMGTYNTMLAWPSVRGRDREVLYSVLLKVAHYRDKVPRPIDTSPDGLGVVQKQTDAFLHTIEAQPLEPSVVYTCPDCKKPGTGLDSVYDKK
jgi:hypothetical protein